MKKIVYAILILSVIVIVNVYLFYSNEGYATFIKSIKYGQIKKTLITDEYLTIDKSLSPCIDNNIAKIEPTKVEIPIQNINTGELNKINKNDTIIENNLIQKDYKTEINNILKIFSSYNLKEKKYDEYYKVFGLTDEYPDKYSIYSGKKNIELYVFTGKNYQTVYDFFNIIGEKVTIKETSTFGIKTFFINTKENDNKVRIVIDNGGIVFGLMIGKNQYNEIKKVILNNFNKK